jgi:segregation and condensation protein B
MLNCPYSTDNFFRGPVLRNRPWGRFSPRFRTLMVNMRYLLWSADKEDNAIIGGYGNAQDERHADLEAVLFLAAQPISSRKLAQLAGLADGTKARTLVRNLNRLYDARGYAFRIEEIGGGFQMMTRVKFAPWLRRLHASSNEVRLSAPAMETLAVVAYRQPILRAEIEAIRGVQSGELLRQLIELDLVRIVGRTEELGRPYVYGTSKRFLQIFGLKHIEELPNYSPEMKEETNVKTLTITKDLPAEFTAETTSVLSALTQRQAPMLQTPRGPAEDDEDEEDEDDFEDYDEDEEEEEDEDEEENVDEDEPWEEVDDEDEEEDEDEELEDEEDEDWDDEDWDDEDWDEDEDDWDEDEDEDEDEEAEEEK